MEIPVASFFYIDYTNDDFQTPAFTGVTTWGKNFFKLSTLNYQKFCRGIEQ